MKIIALGAILVGILLTNQVAVTVLTILLYLWMFFSYQKSKR